MFVCLPDTLLEDLAVEGLAKRVSPRHPEGLLDLPDKWWMATQTAIFPGEPEA